MNIFKIISNHAFIRQENVLSCIQPFSLLNLTSHIFQAIEVGFDSTQNMPDLFGIPFLHLAFLILCIQLDIASYSWKETACELSSMPYLICHCYKNSEKIYVPSQGSVEAIGKHKSIEHVRHRHNAQHEVVPIRLNEVMSSNGRGVNVVLSKGPNERSPNQRIHRTPSICTPVNQSGNKKIEN